MGLFNFFMQEIAIDLGTANTIIYYEDKVVVDEPSIVAKDRSTGQQFRLQIIAGGDAECGVEIRGLTAAEQPCEPRRGHGDGTAHDKGEAGIPRAKDVEKVQHLSRVRHARDDKANAKDEAGE